MKQQKIKSTARKMPIMENKPMNTPLRHIDVAYTTEWRNARITTEWRNE